MIDYYARDEKEKSLDDLIRKTAMDTGDKAEMARFVQGMEILSHVRMIEDILLGRSKGYPVDDGYMGWIEEDRRYRLFASEADYREFIGEK